jgi:hypothetical protein
MPQPDARSDGQSPHAGGPAHAAPAPPARPVRARRCRARSASAPVRAARSCARTATTPRRRPVRRGDRSAAGSPAASRSRAKPARWISPIASAGRPAISDHGSRPWFTPLTYALLTSSSKPAAGATHDLGEEAGLVHRRAGVLDVGARVLQQQPAPQPRLRRIDVRAHPVERRALVGQRQQVVVPAPAVARPREVLAEPSRLEATQQQVEPIEVRAVRRRLAAERQPDAVDRQRPALAHPFQVPQHRAAVDHVVLGVDLEEVRAARRSRGPAREQLRARAPSSARSPPGGGAARRPHARDRPAGGSSRTSGRRRIRPSSR